MSNAMENSSALVELVKRSMSVGILSTGATVVEYSKPLYNISGSTHDPKEIPGHFGKAWKRLLVSHGISDSSECYVTGPEPFAGSHPGFSVGGHMTPNEDGSVTGGICYLMPLCYWHNSTSNNGIAFAHKKTKMLRLTGYLEGELAATFALRLPAADPYAMLYFDGDNWEYRNLSEDEANTIQAAKSNKSLMTQSEPSILFKREPVDKTLHFVDAVNLAAI